MKIWLTYPFDDRGFEEVETMNDPTSVMFAIDRGWGIETFHNYREGDRWHRTKEAAIATAKAFRADRLKKATADAARLASLPDFAE